MAMKFFYIVSVISCLYSLSAVAENGPSSGKHQKSRKPRVRITGGEEAVPHAYPYHVQVTVDEHIFCGGSLISPNYVLSAAHCVIDIDEEITVTLGAHYLSDKTTQVHIKGSDVIFHKNYNTQSHQNDIALIRLASPAPLNDKIKTISLPSRSHSTNNFLDVKATSTGWGRTGTSWNPFSSEFPDALRVVHLTVMDLEKCAEWYNDDSMTYVTKMNLCTSGFESKGICNGDSGGPLVYLDKQIGIASLRSFCNTRGPSVFTRVDKYLDWIEKYSDVVSQNTEFQKDEL